MTITTSTVLDSRTRRGMAIVVLYPVCVCLISIALNIWVFGVRSMVVALPSAECVRALVVAAVLITLNHTWLMTATELTRARFRLFATPEEWAASGTSAAQASADGISELQRHHNAHRNATENTASFILLAMAFMFTSPSASAAYAWLVGFAVARVGHAFGYLGRSDGIRGIAMTIGLLAMYGLATHLVLGLL